LEVEGKMGFMDIAKRMGDKLGKHKPLATAFLIVALTVISVGFLSCAFGHHAKDARFGPMMHARLGAPQTNATFGDMPPMPSEGGMQTGWMGRPRQNGNFGGQPPQVAGERFGGMQQEMPQGCTCGQGQPA
jgi:hypothetical protein